MSFFGFPKLFPLASPEHAPDNGLSIASLLDIAATKSAVVQVRAEAKDYLDLHALLTSTHVSLSQALAGARKLYGQSFNPQITLKALSYFEDGDVAQLPKDIKDYLAAAACGVDLGRLPII